LDYLLALNDGLKILVGVSIFFVWVVRYQNIVEEFKIYQLPNWLRDIVGIFKITFAIMLQTTSAYLVLLGSAGIVFLMVAAQFTHFRMKTSYFNRLPSMVLMLICLLLFSIEYSLL
jgi:hypothetical protein|tara:strand:- start:1271 stop:1618 length:348 start_codon:yes stop_codon:yes gene_type:complete